MYKLETLSNGLACITVNLPHLESVTTWVGVGAGSRYETKETNGISHFMEHMFFKGSKRFPKAEQIATLIEGKGGITNASTGQEMTMYWIKSASAHLEQSIDILSSMLREPLLDPPEIEKEKGAVIQELKMRRDHPSVLVWDLYNRTQFGDQPLGWDVGGSEGTVNSFSRDHFLSYLQSLYSPKNMVLVFAGKIPKNIGKLSEKYFCGLPDMPISKFLPYRKSTQKIPIINIFEKNTEQVSIVLGVEGFNAYDVKRYPATVLSTILGAGMSSKLFIEVRERRGLAYTVYTDHDSYLDTGYFAVFAGLDVNKATEGLRVIKDELEKTALAYINSEDIQKAKDMIRGRRALALESTQYLAHYFGSQFVLRKHIESFEDYLKKIDNVTQEEVKMVAEELFRKEKYTLQIVGSFNDPKPFYDILSA